MTTLLDKLARARRAPAGPPGLPTPDSGSWHPPLARAGLSFDRVPIGAAVTETARICALPRTSHDGASCGLDGGELRLRPLQSSALAAIRDTGGLLGLLGVGHGKTWIALLAGTVLQADFAIVLTKASLVAAMDRERVRLRPHFPLIPMRILSYEFLSQKRSSELLEDLVRPFRRVVVVADEAHSLSGLTSARTRRVIRLFQGRPDLHFVALSGTLLRRSIEDCAHLSELALRDGSPFPREKAHLEAWKECLDVDGRPGSEHWERIRPLAAWAGYDLPRLRGEKRQSAIRSAFRERLKATSGVVASDESSIGCSLELIPVTCKVPKPIEDFLAVLKADGADPDGEPVESDMDQWRRSREVASGFFYRWIWPNGPDLEWLLPRRDWFRRVRAELRKQSGPGYDSPALVEERIAWELETRSYERRRAIHDAWVKWSAVRDRYRPAPPTEAVWISDFLVRSAVELARRIKTPAIVWYGSDAVGAGLRAAGLDVFGAGTELEAVAGRRTVAASLNVFGTGANLQAWSRAIVVEPPSSGDAWEQLLGRLHRPGQTADEVVFYVYQHAEPFVRALESATEKARFVEETTGNPQKLRYCTRGEETRA